MTFIWWVIVGGIAGWVAGLIMKGRGFGVLGNIVVGIIGAVLGGWIFNALNINLNDFLTSLIGAIILLFLISLIKRPESA